MQHPGEAGRSVRVTDPSGKSEGSVNQGFIRNGSVNSHDWYGFLTNLQHQINDNFTANIGLDG